MSALLRLPHELMLEILEHLFKDEDARTPSFTSLCRASRGLRVLAEPFLYRIFDRPGPHRIEQFSQKFLARPDLANHVRSVDIGFVSENYQCFQPDPTPFEVDKWIDDDDAADNAAACVGHIIPATAKIEKLRLVYDCGARPSWWKFMEPALDSHNSQLYHGYQHLRTVEIACLPGVYNEVPIGPLYPIFQLPSLRSLEIRGCTGKAFAMDSLVPGWGNESEVPREDPWNELESPVERLLVLKSELGNRTLDRLLRGCKALKHFHYEMDRLSFYQETLDYKDFGVALACHSKSLETLQIDFASDQAAQIW
ncbi:hypothetical protein BCR34DRAFT_609089 [Clohesyomyces aquaticus]|uniref:F-box domain-containing protein n=1 Tax=Clohesyomyces aquaticus TaxID=1231657 RepID=A0A1Y1XYG0_9PLEO|nr:hypothetical protein BCR34DRAFT_609089 [Clohesyomyces aquaticus]